MVFGQRQVRGVCLWCLCVPVVLILLPFAVTLTAPYFLFRLLHLGPIQTFFRPPAFGHQGA